MPRSMLTTTGPTLSSARWAGDYLGRDRLVPGGARVDASQFNAIDAVTVVVGAAGAAIDDVAVPVAALSGPIPSGTVLDFGGKKFARLSAAAAADDVSLAVDALATALVVTDTATYPGTETVKYLPSGSIIGRTLAERDAGTAFGPAADADDEVFLVAFDVPDVTDVPDVELYRAGGVVYENFLPTFAAASATIKAALRAKYACAVGAA